MAKKITEELVNEHIADIPNRTDEELAYYFQCASSHDNTKLMKPYKMAVDKERKRRGKIQAVAEVSLDEVVAKEKAAKKAEEAKSKLQEY